MSIVTSADRIGANGQGASIQVPTSFQPDADTVLMNCESRLYDFPAATPQFTPASTSQIMIPQHRSRYILGGSTYLQFRVNLTSSITLSPTASASNPRYCPGLFFGGGPTKSAAALIERITVSAPNGQVLADIPNYAQWHNLLLVHAASEDYIRTSSINESAFQTAVLSPTPNAGPAGVNNTQTVSGTLDISLPLALGLFSEQKAFPMWALNGPLIILIQWASPTRAFGACLQVYPTLFSGTDLLQAPAINPATFTIASASYSGTQLGLRMRCVDVDVDYISQQRMLMMQGKVLTYNYRQTQNLITKLDSTGSASYNFGLNVSSLLAVFGVNVMDNECIGVGGAPVCAPSLHQALGTDATNVGSWGFSGNQQKDVRLFRDGTQLSTFNLYSGGQDDAFTPLMEAMGILFSTSNNSIAKRVSTASPDNNPSMLILPNSMDNFRVAGGAAHGVYPSSSFNLSPAWQVGTYRGGSVYAPAAMAWGISTRICNDADVSNRGSQCSQLQVNVTGGTSNTGYLYVYYVYSCAISFDGTGNCVVRR